MAYVCCTFCRTWSSKLTERQMSDVREEYYIPADMNQAVIVADLRNGSPVWRIVSAYRAVHPHRSMNLVRDGIKILEALSYTRNHSALESDLKYTSEDRPLPAYPYPHRIFPVVDSCVKSAIEVSNLGEHGYQLTSTHSFLQMPHNELFIIDVSDLSSVKYMYMRNRNAFHSYEFFERSVVNHWWMSFALRTYEEMSLVNPRSEISCEELFLSDYGFFHAASNYAIMRTHATAVGDKYEEFMRFFLKAVYEPQWITAEDLQLALLIPNFHSQVAFLMFQYPLLACSPQHDVFIWVLRAYASRVPEVDFHRFTMLQGDRLCYALSLGIFTTLNLSGVVCVNKAILDHVVSRHLDLKMLMLNDCPGITLAETVAVICKYNLRLQHLSHREMWDRAYNRGGNPRVLQADAPFYGTASPVVQMVIVNINDQPVSGAPPLAFRGLLDSSSHLKNCISVVPLADTFLPPELIFRGTMQALHNPMRRYDNDDSEWWEHSSQDYKAVTAMDFMNPIHGNDKLARAYSPIALERSTAERHTIKLPAPGEWTILVVTRYHANGSMTQHFAFLTMEKSLVGNIEDTMAYERVPLRDLVSNLGFSGGIGRVGGNNSGSSNVATPLSKHGFGADTTASIESMANGRRPGGAQVFSRQQNDYSRGNQSSFGASQATEYGTHSHDPDIAPPPYSLHDTQNITRRNAPLNNLTSGPCNQRGRDDEVPRLPHFVFPPRQVAGMTAAPRAEGSGRTSEIVGSNEESHGNSTIQFSMGRNSRQHQAAATNVASSEARFGRGQPTNNSQRRSTQVEGGFPANAFTHGPDSRVPATYQLRLRAFAHEPEESSFTADVFNAVDTVVRGSIRKLTKLRDNYTNCSSRLNVSGQSVKLDNAGVRQKNSKMAIALSNHNGPATNSKHKKPDQVDEKTITDNLDNVVIGDFNLYLAQTLDPDDRHNFGADLRRYWANNDRYLHVCTPEILREVFRRIHIDERAASLDGAIHH